MLWNLSFALECLTKCEMLQMDLVDHDYHFETSINNGALCTVEHFSSEHNA